MSVELDGGLQVVLAVLQLVNITIAVKLIGVWPPSMDCMVHRLRRSKSLVGEPWLVLKPIGVVISKMYCKNLNE